MADFEGVYEVNCRAGIIRNARTLRVKKPSLGKNGYPYIGLCKNGIRHINNVHRLVANAAFGYYGIQTDGLLVMHLDEERHKPRIDNLAIGTNKENMNFPKAKQRCCEARKGKHFSEETRKKLSESRKGEKNPMFGKHLSTETKKKLSDAHKGKKGYWFGRHRIEETRKKLSEATAKKAVGAYKNGQLVLTFQSAREADRNGFKQSNVCACCTGRRKVHKGYEWKFL